MNVYDLIVIGSGPAGEKAAVKAAYFLKKVAIIEKLPLMGGSATYYTVPSKAFRELAVKTQKQEMEKKNVIREFLNLKDDLVKLHSETVRENLVNHGIDIYQGVASFVDSHHIEVTHEEKKVVIEGENIIIAGGVKTLLPNDIPVDGKRVHIVETLRNITSVPSSICISGAGVIGCEYASIFSALGCKVYLTDERPRMLGRVDSEIVDYLKSHMKKNGIIFEFEKKITSIDVAEDVTIALNDGTEIKVEILLVVGRRKSQLKDLHLENAGLEIPDDKIIPVNEYFQTNIPNIYAVGDIVGPPSLVNTGMDQGRYAVSQMFHLDDMNSFCMSNMPQGIYTIPEISSVGLTEDAAIEQGLDIIVGRAFHGDIARGMIRKVDYGMLKLIIDKSSEVILGVNIIGDQATELVHYGVDLVINRKTLKDVINSNFNFPCLHELYKYAAYDGLATIAGRHMRVHHISKEYKY